MRFLSTPSGWRATLPYRFGRRICEFLSTPSGWRATAQSFRKSIALRLYFYPRPPGGGRPEALNPTSFPSIYFYPRPPGGGRQLTRLLEGKQRIFLSTPSGWRATGRGERRGTGDVISIHALRVEGDLQTGICARFDCLISIHALRVEGDRTRVKSVNHIARFLSTPSGWRATSESWPGQSHQNCISIHALRVEGDYER